MEVVFDGSVEVVSLAEESYNGREDIRNGWEQ